jgi:hypothetical protein
MLRVEDPGREHYAVKYYTNLKHPVWVCARCLVRWPCLVAHARIAAEAASG